MNDFVLTHHLPCVDRSLGKIIIQLDNPGGSHVAGESITGRICARMHMKASDMSTEALSLTLLGVEKYQKITSQKTKFSNKIIDLQFDVDTRPTHRGMFKDKIGDYEYPFELVLPEWLPSSVYFED